jgi:hypothetical protein
LLNRADRYIVNQNANLSLITIDCFQDKDATKNQIDNGSTKIHTAELEFANISSDVPVIKTIKGFLAPELYTYYVAQKTNWYDRNPSYNNILAGANNQAPHSGAERFSYKVPQNRRAYVEYASAKIFRMTAADNPQAVTQYIDVIQLNAPLANQECRICYNTILTNNIGDHDETTITQSLLLSTGDTLIGLDSDYSTNGTVSYYYNAKITEFDA